VLASTKFVFLEQKNLKLFLGIYQIEWICAGELSTISDYCHVTVVNLSLVVLFNK